MFFGSLGLPTLRQNSIKRVPRAIKIQVKIWSASWFNFQWILEANSGPRSFQNPAKINEKSMKDGLPNQSKFCMLFEWPFSGSWRRTWLQKPSKTDPGGWVDCSCFWAWKGLGRPWGGLGGVLGPLGASWGPRPEFNRFWLIFDGFW